MSNALGIAAVSAVLRDLLNNGLIDASVGDVTVSAQSPDKVKLDGDETSQLNLFLYRVTPNQGWRNVGLPSVDSAGTSRLSNPPLALDLHYLLSAYSDEELKGEVLLGYAMQALHETAVLTREVIRKHFTVDPTSVTGAGLPSPLNTLIAGELADQVELIKLTPEAMSTEEISKLWTAFGARYRPTAAYQASVVLIEGRRTTRSAPPVRKRAIFVRSLREPVIEDVQSDAGPGLPIVSTSKLILLGRQLVGEVTDAIVSRLTATIDEADDERLVVQLPPGLRAGVQAVHVAHLIPMGEPAVPHRGFESNVAAFVLRPTFTGLTLAPPAAGPGPYSGDATVTVAPAVGRAQRIQLLLNRDSSTDALAYSFTAKPRTSDGAPIVVPLVDVERGDYFVRVMVDGAESPLDLDPASPSFGPRVTV